MIELSINISNNRVDLDSLVLHKNAYNLHDNIIFIQMYMYVAMCFDFSLLLLFQTKINCEVYFIYDISNLA